MVVPNCPGSLTREICELSVLFDTVYKSKNTNFRDVWAAVVEAMEWAFTGSRTLNTMDSYKVALPSLAMRKLDS
jgi:hypothetical protein